MRKARDEEFQDYVRRRRETLLKIATVMTGGDRHLAEDLVQVCLTKLYLAWPRIRAMKLDGYARRVLVNALIDDKRGLARRREQAWAEVPDRPQSAEADGNRDDLLEALSQLPPGMRAAVVLRHVEGLSTEETADALRCSTGTVKSQTARGLARLRDTRRRPQSHLLRRHSMIELTDRLALLGATGKDLPSEDIVAADLARGRAALRRTRVRIGGALSAAALIVAGTAVYLGGPGTGTTHHQHQAAATAPVKIRLVNYSGQDPQGFTIASVPQGFGLQEQASSGYEFVLAPPGADQSPGSFAGKLVVTAEAGSELGHWQKFGQRTVAVNGSQGRIGDDGTATQLWFTAGHGVVVDVQAWDSIGLTDQQLTDFANGVTTTPALQLSHG